MGALVHPTFSFTLYDGSFPILPSIEYDLIFGEETVSRGAFLHPRAHRKLALEALALLLHFYQFITIPIALCFGDWHNAVS